MGLLHPGRPFTSTPALLRTPFCLLSLSFSVVLSLLSTLYVPWVSTLPWTRTWPVSLGPLGLSPFRGSGSDRPSHTPTALPAPPVGPPVSAAGSTAQPRTQAFEFQSMHSRPRPAPRGPGPRGRATIGGRARSRRRPGRPRTPRPVPPRSPAGPRRGWTSLRGRLWLTSWGRGLSVLAGLGLHRSRPRLEGLGERSEGAGRDVGLEILRV